MSKVVVTDEKLIAKVGATVVIVTPNSITSKV